VAPTPASAGAGATHSTPTADRGEAQQSQVVPVDEQVILSDPSTWTEFQYNRDDPEAGSIIYYDIPKQKRTDARSRGARFDWAVKYWYGDAMEAESITLLDAKFKRRLHQPPRRWHTKEERYPLCYPDCDVKDGTPPPPQYSAAFNPPVGAAAPAAAAPPAAAATQQALLQALAGILGPLLQKATA